MEIRLNSLTISNITHKLWAFVITFAWAYIKKKSTFPQICYMKCFRDNLFEFFSAANRCGIKVRMKTGAQSWPAQHKPLGHWLTGIGSPIGSDRIGSDRIVSNRMESKIATCPGFEVYGIMWVMRCEVLVLLVLVLLVC